MAAALRITCALFLTVLTLASSALADEADSAIVLKKIVKKIDELYRSKSSYSELEMAIITPHWERTLAMNIWTEGMKKTFIRITSPAKEKGIATLRIENEMWNYLPKTNKVIKIPPSMMMSSWMGSDFTNDDLVKEYSLVKDYIFELTSVEDANDDLLYAKLTPREGLPIVWGHIIIAVKRDDYMPVWQKYYDEKGKLMRLMNFRDVRLFGKHQIPTIMEMIPQNKEGQKTVIRYFNIEFDKKIDKDIFSLRNLRSRK